MDGRIIISRITNSDQKAFVERNAFIERMADFNIFPPMGEDPEVKVRKGFSGYSIEISGPEVLGYLIDDQGLEASQSDLEYFAMDCLKNGESLQISGHHHLDDDQIMISRTSICKKDDAVIINPVRTLFQIGKGARTISDSESLFQSEPSP